MKPTILLLMLVLSVTIAVINAEAFTYGGFDINFIGKAHEKYDSNVTYSKNKAKEDLITDLLVGIDVVKEEKTWEASLLGNLRQEIFASNRKFDNLSEDVTLDLRKEFTMYDRIFLNNSFLHADEPTTFDDASGSGDGRNSYCRNNMNLRYERDMSKQIMVSAEYTNGIYIHTRSGYTDSYMNRGGLSMMYMPGPETTFSLMYDITRRDFDAYGDILKNTALAGIRQYLTPQIYYDCMAGADFSRSIDDENFTTVNLMMALTDNFTKTTSGNIKLEKKYNDTFYSSSQSDYWRFSGTLKSRPLKRLAANASAYYSRSEYTNVGSTYEYFGARLSLIYDIRENIQADLSYSYSQKESGAISGYDKSVMSVGVSVLF